MNNNILPNPATFPSGFQILLHPDFLGPFDELVSFLELADGIDFDSFFTSFPTGRRPAVSYPLLLKAWLFIKMIEPGCSLRKAAGLCRHDLRLLFLCQMRTPSFMCFRRMLEKLDDKVVHSLFIQLNRKIAQRMGLGLEQVYVDGTKIEANAGRYSFVYRKRTLNYWKNKNGQIDEQLENLIYELGYDFELQPEYSSRFLFEVAQLLMDQMVRENIRIVYGRGKKKECCAEIL